MNTVPHSSNTELIDVSYVASLARLDLSDEEIQRFQKPLDHILEHVRKLGELNLYGVEPTFQTTASSNVFRADVVQPSLPREQALANAPQARDGLFIVPKILE